MLVSLIILPVEAIAQESIIDQMRTARVSIVHIEAVRSEFKKNPDKVNSVRAFKYFQRSAGVIIDPTGIIVTNLHTIWKAKYIKIKLYDGKVYNASIKHLWPQRDLVLLKIDTPYLLKPVEFANSNLVKLRDEVVNIGSSDFLKETISGGQINRIGKNPQNNGEVEIIQVYMDIYEGDSGGPLFDHQGRFVGMMTAKFEGKRRASLAIPSNKIKKLYLEFRK